MRHCRQWYTASTCSWLLMKPLTNYSCTADRVWFTSATSIIINYYEPVHYAAISYPRDQSVKNVDEQQQRHDEAKWNTRWVKKYTIPVKWKEKKHGMVNNSKPLPAINHRHFHKWIMYWYCSHLIAIVHVGLNNNKSFFCRCQSGYTCNNLLSRMNLL